MAQKSSRLAKRNTRKAEASRELPAAIRTDLETWPGVTVQSKFHNLSFSIGNKVFAFTRPEGIAIKLPAEQCRELMAARKAVPLVMGTRTMKEWAVIIAHDGPKDYDISLLKSAMAFVVELKRKGK